jgi:hypothetical protein
MSLFGLCLIGLCGTIFYGYFRRTWIAELASATEGDLSVESGTTRSGPPEVQIGRSGVIIRYTGEIDPKKVEMFRLLYDAGLRVYRGKNGELQVSTSIRDKDGNLVAELTDNHWRVYPAYCSEKNFTKSTLEIKDNGGHVVLQIHLFPDRVMIQGIWSDQYGAGKEFVEDMVDPETGIFITWPDRDRRKVLEKLIPPMFEYPSSRHLGEFVNQ